MYMIFNRIAKSHFLFLLLGASVTGTSDAKTSIEKITAECRSFASQISTDKTLGSASVRANLLQKHSSQCKGIGTYDSSLAALFQQAGLYDEADRVAYAGMPTANEFRPNLLNVLALNQLGRGNVDKAYQMGLEIARQFPKYAPIYGLLGQIDSKLNRWDRAHQDAKKLIELDPSALSFMALATTLYQLKRYPEVLDAVNYALKIEPQRIGNASGLTEGIYALILLNRREEATHLLTRHINANPNWRASVPMIKAAQELGLAQ